MQTNKTLLIPGGAGFIGSNFVPYFLNKYENYNIINLDLLTYAGDLEKIKEHFNITIPFWKDSLDECLRVMEARR